METLNNYLNNKFENPNEILNKILPFINNSEDELLKYRINLIINSIENDYFDYTIDKIENIYQLNLKKWNKFIEQEKSFERMKQISTETTDIFKCMKCYKNKCIFTTAQIRSGDEGTTIFISCINCGNKWKQ